VAWLTQGATDRSRTPRREGREVPGIVRGLLVLLFMYLFLVGIAFLEAGIAATGEGFQAALLNSVSNPISGLCAGLLATVLVQSSSVSTSTIVGMVGAGTLPVSLAVPMIMGANIGTTVTNTLASLASIRRPEEFRRAFAAATVHDFFNLFAVLLLLPLELLTGLLSGTADYLSDNLRGAEFTTGEPRRSAIRVAVRYPVGMIRDMIEPGPTMSVIFLVLGLGLIFLALTLITKNMRRLVADQVEQVMNRIIGRGGGAAGIVVGIGVTVAVQSSTITTSILVPLVAAGLLTLRSCYPITLGANVGTTITALLASLAVVRPEGLTIALVHTMFNVTALILIYPVRQVRDIPVRLAEATAELAVRNHTIVFAYVVGLFLVLPLLGVFLIR
jgi:solute carrier family 34 (sodium-dependent phosphate cotransporter)